MAINNSSHVGGSGVEVVPPPPLPLPPPDGPMSAPKNGINGPPQEFVYVPWLPPASSPLLAESFLSRKWSRHKYRRMRPGRCRGRANPRTGWTSRRAREAATRIQIEVPPDCIVRAQVTGKKDAMPVRAGEIQSCVGHIPLRGQSGVGDIEIVDKISGNIEAIASDRLQDTGCPDSEITDIEQGRIHIQLAIPHEVADIDYLQICLRGTKNVDSAVIRERPSDLQLNISSSPSCPRVDGKDAP